MTHDGLWTIDEALDVAWEALIQSGDTAILASDFDGTLIEGDCADAYFAFQLSHGTFDAFGSRDALLRQYVSLLDDGKRRFELLASLHRGMTLDSLKHSIQSFLGTEFEGDHTVAWHGRHMRVGLYPIHKTLALLDRALEANLRVIVVTASLEPLVDRLIHELLDHPDGKIKVLGARLRLDEPSGVFTGGHEEPIPYAEGKVERWRTYLSSQWPVVMLGDSRGDVPLLTHASCGLFLLKDETYAWTDELGALPHILRVRPF